MKPLRVLIFGSEGSGKTELYKHLLNPEAPLDKNHSPTLAVDLSNLSQDLIDKDLIKEPINIQLIDTPGTEQQAAQHPQYYKGVRLGIYCLDLTTPLAKQQIEKDLQQFREKAGSQVKIFLVGTKDDHHVANQVSDAEFDQLSIEPAYHFCASHRVSCTHSEDIVHFRKALFRHLSTNDVDQECKNHLDAALEYLFQPSELHTRITQLKQHMASLSAEKQKIIGFETFNLIATLRSSLCVQVKAQAVLDYHDRCVKVVDEKLPSVLAILAAITTTALVVTLAAFIGFGIGFAAGFWTGPGALIIGLITASTATKVLVSGAIASAIPGAFLGFFAAEKTHEKLSKPEVAKTKQTLRDISLIAGRTYCSKCPG